MIRFIKGANQEVKDTRRKGILTPNVSVLNELAKVAINETNPAFPKTMRIDAIRLLWILRVINSDSRVVNPVPVKQRSEEHTSELQSH